MWSWRSCRPWNASIGPRRCGSPASSSKRHVFHPFPMMFIDFPSNFIVFYPLSSCFQPFSMGLRGETGGLAARQPVHKLAKARGAAVAGHEELGRGLGAAFHGHSAPGILCGTPPTVRALRGGLWAGARAASCVQAFFQVLGWKELLNMAMMTSICIEMDANRCKSYRNV